MKRTDTAPLEAPTVTERMQAYSKTKQADYTKEAEVYDQTRFSDYLGRFYVDLSNNVIYDTLQVKDGEKVLDLATGTGRVAVGLAEKGVSLIAADLTFKMLERAKEKVTEKRLEKQVSFNMANALHLPYKDNTFDKIVSIRFFHILPYEMQKAILKEIRRVLKPGGLCVIEFNSPFAGLFLWAVRRDHLVVWPREVQSIFEGMRIIKKVGIMLPGVGRIARFSLKAGMFLGRRITSFFPFNHLSNQILIIAKKE